MKRSRSRISALGIFAVVGSCLLQPSSGDDSSSSQNQDYTGDQFISQECAPRGRKRKVQIKSVSLLCDSQGDDDAGGYKDSTSCKPGDQAKAAVSFNIQKMKTSYAIFIDLNSSAMGKIQRIYNHTNICNLGTIAYWGEDKDAGDDLYANARNPPCPLRNGPYSFFTAFTVPQYSKDPDLELTPDIRVHFFTAERVPVGCVETGSLAEVAFNEGMERRGERFFGISFVIFIVVFAFFLMGHQRKRNQNVRAKMKLQASMMRRFHYIRTTRSGEISSTPSITPSLSGSFSFRIDNAAGRRADSPPSIPPANGGIA